MKSSINALRIVLIYCIFALAWIYFSDAVLDYFVKDAAQLTAIQTYKGMAFVIVTSLILFSLIKSHFLELYSVQKKLEENEKRLSHVILGAELGYWDWDYVNGKLMLNDKCLELVGLRRDDFDNSFDSWFELIYPADRALVQKTVEQNIEDFKPYIIEFRMQHNDGHLVWIEGSGAVVEKDEKTNLPLRLAGTNKDISFRKKAVEEMTFLAFNDSLTQLPNRIFLKQKLEEFLAMYVHDFAFLFLDLDSFKNINDIYGHTIGDKIIKEVALRFKETIGVEDFIARVGGDEFVILTPDTLHAEELCKALAISIEEPFQIDSETLNLGASIGIALFPQDGNTLEELFKKADTAMYAAKNNGKNRYEFYMQAMTDVIFRSTKMDSKMKRAIENDEFVLHYQPQINIKTGVVVGVEALVRWIDPIKGIIPPGEFISRAEENRLIIPLGEMILRKAFMQHKAWAELGVFSGKMAINISGVQISEENFTRSIEKILREVSVNTHNIEFEVTESYIMKNTKESIITLQNLRNLGFSISVDDFGTGYSSLSYLKALPINRLKIDRSFVKDLPHNKDDSAISKVIIALAKNLVLDVLAEGVETKEQEAFLLENGCEYAQGYLYAKPMDADSFVSFLQHN